MTEDNLWAKYKGSWAYVVRLDCCEVMLSNWRGIKTTTAKRIDITDWRKTPNPNWKRKP